MSHELPIEFRPANAKRWSLKRNEMKISARICTKCGTMEFIGDVETLKNIPRKDT